MPTLANYAWKHTTMTTEAFTAAAPPSLGGDGPISRTVQVTTVQTADIINGPTIPASRAPWVPTEIVVTDGRDFDPEATRKVSIHGHYLKKNGELSTYQVGESWRYLGKWTGGGSLHAMPDWVVELVAQLEPANDSVLT